MGVGLLISPAVIVVVADVVVAVVAVVVVAGGLLLLSTDIVRGCRVAAIELKWRGGKYARNEFPLLITQVMIDRS